MSKALFPSKDWVDVSVNFGDFEKYFVVLTEKALQLYTNEDVWVVPNDL